MFTATEFSQIRAKCLEEFDNLLYKLGIDSPDWSNGDEFSISAQLDGAITVKLSQLMKSDSVYAGYTKLLKLGNIAYELSDTDSALLSKITDNQREILKGATQPMLNAVPATVSNRRSVRRIEDKQISAVPMIGGGIAVVVGGVLLINDATLLGIAAILVGGVGVALGLKGNTVVREVAVDDPYPQKQEKAQAGGAAFTEAEIKEALEVLAQLHKIVQSI